MDNFSDALLLWEQNDERGGGNKERACSIRKIWRHSVIELLDSSITPSFYAPLMRSSLSCTVVLINNYYTVYSRIDSC